MLIDADEENGIATSQHKKKKLRAGASGSRSENHKKCLNSLNYLNESGALNYPGKQIITLFKVFWNGSYGLSKFLSRLNFIIKGGIPSSMEMRSREQWDFPNEWAPLTHLFVVSLLKCKPYLPEAGKIARDVANRFLKTAYNGYFHPQNGMVHFFFYIFFKLSFK